MLRHQLNRVIQILGLEDQDAAQLLLGLGVGTVGNRYLPVLEPQGSRALRRLEGFPAGKVPVLAKDVVVGKALIDESVHLALGHRLPLLGIHVAQADVFHCAASRSIVVVNDYSPYSRSGSPKST